MPNCRLSLTGLIAFAVSIGLASIGRGQVTAQVETIAGETRELQFESIDENSRLIGPGGTDLNLRLDELFSMTLRDTNAAFDPLRPNRILLAQGKGTVLGFENLSFDGDSIKFANPLLLAPLDISSVRAIVFRNDVQVDQAIENPSSNNDRLVVENNEQITTIDGILEGITDDKVQVNFEGKSRSISLPKVLAIVLARLDSEGKSNTSVTVRFDSGETASGVLKSWTDGRVTLQGGKGAMEFDAKRIASLDIQSDRLQFLSDLDPIRVEETTQFAPKRSWRRNRSIEGNPMRLLEKDGERPREFRRGIGMQSYSSLAFDNDGFDILTGLVGIDAETGGRGQCIVRIMGDGINLWEFSLRGESAAVSFEVDVQGITEIELVVDYGQQLDLSDHVDWANIRLLKSE